jgi:hypothetical protein
MNRIIEYVKSLHFVQNLRKMNALTLFLLWRCKRLSGQRCLWGDTNLSFSKNTYIFPFGPSCTMACLTAVLGQHIMKRNMKGAFGLSIP